MMRQVMTIREIMAERPEVLEPLALSVQAEHLVLAAKRVPAAKQALVVKQAPVVKPVRPVKQALVAQPVKQARAAWSRLQAAMTPYPRVLLANGPLQVG